MKTIKVNMNPNPLDVQTIHASQNDGEARQWEFELHNNGELIDTSDITEQLFFKAYKGGTEQLLPENGITPTTSPFKGDIKYPQGLLTDQEFTYRQSPTEEDGLAKITRIKGNTVVWNQLIKVVTGTRDLANLNVSTNSDGTITVSGTANATGTFWLSDTLVNADRYDNDTIYIKAQVLSGNIPDIVLFGNGNYVMTNSKRAKIVSNQPTYNNLVGFRLTNTTVYNFSVKVEAINLTKLGLPNLTKDQFEAFYWLPYYSHNAGSLLSFNGTGIKTVGKNRLNYDVWKTVETRNGTSVWENNGVTITATGNDAYTLYGASSFPVNARVPVRVGESITLSWESDDNVNGDVYISPNGGSAGFVQINNRYGKSLSYTPVDGVEYVTFRFGVASSGNTIHYKNIMIRFADTDSTFEPYTSSTLSLPISTYFPTGMKDAPDGNGGKIYDELTNSKAITRVGSRAYQSGDEDDTSVITDGTTTYYALATPTETSFTTASLVTENAEIHLSNEDGTLIGKCTEELSAEPGFHDAKIKLSDSDGTCYSNKLQLHVERKPS